MSKERFAIESCLNECDCCGVEVDSTSENYSITTRGEKCIGLILCSYCILMLKYNLDDFLMEDEE